ncbi:MAG: SOS response-associated peptidase [Betaproteobacteria bacterium]|nr:SOS response-associated peptidase [Betaproteobacteria bacterium]
MCGRYALHTHPDVIAIEFGLKHMPELKPRYNIAPSSDVLVIREDRERGRLADLYRWGLIPGWAKDPAIGNKLANARGETVAEKPSFRAAFRRWRCLVPASGFYEWKSVGGKKQPYYIRPKGAELFGLAGISELWNGADGPLHTVSLITTEPNELMRGIHDRMPLIVPREDYAAWLDPGNQDAAKLMRFIRSFPAERMESYPVSKAVSYARNEGAELIKSEA